MKRTKIKRYVYPARSSICSPREFWCARKQNFNFFVVSKRSNGLPHDGNTNSSYPLPHPTAPPPTALQHGGLNARETLYRSTPWPSIFNFGAFSHEKTGSHATRATRLGGGVEDGRKHVTSYLTNASPKLTKTCQNQPSKGLGSRL